VGVKRGDEQVSLSYSPFFDEEGNALPDKVLKMDLLRELGDLKALCESYVMKDGVLQKRSVDPGEYLYRL
jgi:hypothetical protein